jgi:hypothetical protein
MREWLKMVTSIFKKYADLLLPLSRLKLLDLTRDCAEQSVRAWVGGDEIEFLDLSYIITPHL